jgi:hypothetical protein
MKNTLTETSNELPDYQHTLTLEDDVKLMLKHDSLTHTQKAIYTHESFKGQNKRRPTLTIKQRIVIDYDKGIMADNINITFEITNHENRGKEFFLGVDISKDSKVFLDINYQKKDDNYVITEIHKGASCIYSESENKDSLMIPAQSPINILTSINIKYGELNIPTVTSSESYGIKIPVSIIA